MFKNLLIAVRFKFRITKLEHSTLRNTSNTHLHLTMNKQVMLGITMVVNNGNQSNSAVIQFVEQYGFYIYIKQKGILKRYFQAYIYSVIVFFILVVPFVLDCQNILVSNVR